MSMTMSETLAYEAGYRHGKEDAMKMSVPMSDIAKRIEWLVKNSYMRSNIEFDAMIWNVLMHGIPERKEQTDAID